MAALHAAHDPDTWAPAAGAALVAIGDADHDISRWAREETPLFGSEDRAANASNVLHGANHALLIASAMATERTWKGRIFAVLEDELFVTPASKVTHLLKEETNRVRPDSSNDKSFPSGHAQSTASYGALTRNNLERTDWSPTVRRSFTIGSRMFSYGTAWARVEAGKHYLSDVLAGAALGNFVSSVIDEVVHAKNVNVRVAVSLGGGDVVIAIRF